MSNVSVRTALIFLHLLAVTALSPSRAVILLPAVQKVRESGNRVRCGNNLKQLALALHGFHNDHRHFPPATRGSGSDYPFLAWSARILSYIEQESLWHLTQEEYRGSMNPWRPTPHKPLTHPVRLFVCPSDGREVGIDGDGRPAAFLHYLGSSGRDSLTRDGVMYYESRIGFAEIHDGASQTLLVGERPPGASQYFGWWYAGVGQGLEGAADSHLNRSTGNRQQSNRETVVAGIRPTHRDPAVSRASQPKS